MSKCYRYYKLCNNFIAELHVCIINYFNFCLEVVTVTPQNAKYMYINNE